MTYTTTTSAAHLSQESRDKRWAPAVSIRFVVFGSLGLWVLIIVTVASLI